VRTAPQAIVSHAGGQLDEHRQRRVALDGGVDEQLGALEDVRQALGAAQARRRRGGLQAAAAQRPAPGRVDAGEVDGLGGEVDPPHPRLAA
jgi:hypothetical protein